MTLQARRIDLVYVIMINGCVYTGRKRLRADGRHPITRTKNDFFEWKFYWHLGKAVAAARSLAGWADPTLYSDIYVATVETEEGELEPDKVMAVIRGDRIVWYERGSDSGKELATN